MQKRRLIDVDELLGKIADTIREMPTPVDLYDDGVISGLDTAFNMIETASIIDAVEVVKCKECRYKETCSILWEAKEADGNGYCSLGERRDK